MPRDYFAAVPSSRGDLTIAVQGAGAIALFEIFLGFYSDWGSLDFSKDVLEFSIVRGEGLLSLYCLNLLFIGPVTEEAIYRGFLYRGWSQALGPLGAIVLTSALFGATHLQYSWLGMLDVAVSGLFLGWLRWRSGSIIPPILAHATMNVVALIALLIAA